MKEFLEVLQMQTHVDRVVARGPAGVAGVEGGGEGGGSCVFMRGNRKIRECSSAKKHTLDPRIWRFVFFLQTRTAPKGMAGQQRGRVETELVNAEKRSDMHSLRTPGSLRHGFCLLNVTSCEAKLHDMEAY